MRQDEPDPPSHSTPQAPPATAANVHAHLNSATGAVSSAERYSKDAMSSIVGLINVDPAPEWTNRLFAAPIPASGSENNTRVWLGRAVKSSKPLVVQHEASSTVLVYQGRLSGHNALRERLAERGVKFMSDDPGETILRAYQVWGESLPEKLEGPCAFILWDAQAHRLIAACDRIGEKRLHIAPQGDGFILASDLRVVLALRSSAAAPDPQALAYLLTLGYVPASTTIWKGITKLEAGECLSWDKANGLRRRRYWEPPRSEGAAEHAASFRELFEQTLERACAPGEPVGLMLSAGLDSSSIALGLSRLRRPITALGFNSPGVADESPLAEELAQHLKIPYVQAASISMPDIEALLDEVVPTLEEPPCHPAAMTIHLMCRAAAEHCSVLLTGDGAEETLGGREWYNAKPSDGEKKKRQQPLLRRLRRALVHGVSSRQPTRRRDANGVSPLHGLINNMRPSIFPPEDVAGLLTPSGISFSEVEMLAPLVGADAPALPPRRRLQRLDLMNYCANVVVPKVHQPAAAQGLDLRLPFVDHRLVDWAIAQPVDPRELTERKPMLRDYLRGHVPDPILTLPKHGLNLTFSKLLPVENAFKQLHEGYWVRNGYMVKDVETYVRPRDINWRGRLWSLYLLERWAAHWLR